MKIKKIKVKVADNSNLNIQKYYDIYAKDELIKNSSTEVEVIDKKVSNSNKYSSNILTLILGMFISFIGFWIFTNGNFFKILSPYLGDTYIFRILCGTFFMGMGVFIFKKSFHKIILEIKCPPGSNLSKNKLYMEFINDRRNFDFKEKNEKVTIPASKIHGILDIDNEYFWNHHSYTKDDYLRITQDMHNGNEQAIHDFYYHPIKVYKFKDIYILIDDGRHRVAAAQELEIDIDVVVSGDYL